MTQYVSYCWLHQKNLTESSTPEMIEAFIPL